MQGLSETLWKSEGRPQLSVPKGEHVLLSKKISVPVGPSDVALTVAVFCEKENKVATLEHIPPAPTFGPHTTAGSAPLVIL